MKGVVLSIRRNCPFGAIGVQSGQSQEKIMKKEDSRDQALIYRGQIVPAFVRL